MESMVTITKRCCRFDAANKSVFLPMELIITEILSLLSVKAIVRFKCVSKLWNTLTSDSNFVDKHLKASSRNLHLTLTWHDENKLMKNIVPIPVHRLLEETSANVSSNDDLYRIENPSRLVGSCNGLLCFLSSKYKPEPFKYLLHIYNPATRTRSQFFEFTFGRNFKFTFGYDASTRTYKVIAFQHELENSSSEVKVFNLGDNCWRNIQNFPLVLPNSMDLGVHFCGTINWFAWDKSINTVILSLDLSTETYKQFLLPDHAQIYMPYLRVLMDSLCLSHESNKTEFILWKMKEYGVQESWTLLFKISYQNLAMQGLHYPLVCLYVNGDIVILARACCEPAFIYNLKDKTVVELESENTIHMIHWFVESKDYVESLVSVQ